MRGRACMLSVFALASCGGGASAQTLLTSTNLRADLENAQATYERAQQLLVDRPDQARRLFRSAAQKFSGIAASGVVNGYLQYNLANSHLQAGDVGRAILHFHRAQRLIPGNDMLADNLAVARSRCLTTIQPGRGNIFLRSVFFWHYSTSVASRTRTAVVLCAAVWLILMIRAWAPRRSLTVAAIMVAAVAGASGVSATVNNWTDRNAPPGVVVAMDVAVYKGPGTGYRRRFEQPLQPGVEFTLRGRRGGWWKIELADGNTGWVENSVAELIPSG